MIYGVLIWHVLTQRILPLSWKYKGNIQGIVGEKYVDKHLRNELGDENLIIRDLKLRGEHGNIDHAVIGKNGIYVIETKTHQGKIKCYNDDWYQVKNNNSKKLGYSPSKQVVYNVVQLKKFLEKYYPKLSNYYINALIIAPFQEGTIEVHKAPTNCKIFNDVNELIAFIHESREKVSIEKNELNNLKKLLEDNVEYMET